MSAEAPRRADRLGARIVTGSAARGVAFALDFFAALLRLARGDPSHPEERREPALTDEIPDSRERRI